jgi:hypothetical protein
MNNKIKVGYYSMPDYNDKGGQARQIVLLEQLIDEKVIEGTEWHRFYDRTPIKANSPAVLGKKRVDAQIKYIDSIVEKLLKNGNIYANLEDLAKGVAEQSKANGGVIVYPNTGLKVATGFAVPFVTLLKHKSLEIEAAELTPKVIEEFISKHYHDFLKYKGKYFAARFDNGRWYLDVSDVVLYEKTAVELAKSRGIETVYNIANKKTISTVERL